MLSSEEAIALLHAGLAFDPSQLNHLTRNSVVWVSEYHLSGGRPLERAVTAFKKEAVKAALEIAPKPLPAGARKEMEKFYRFAYETAQEERIVVTIEKVTLRDLL